MNLLDPEGNVSLRALIFCVSLVIFGAVTPCSGAGLKRAVGTQKIQFSGKDIRIHPISAKTRAVFARAYANLPLYFIANRGQVNGKVAFYERGSGHTTFFTREGVVLAMEKPEARTAQIRHEQAQGRAALGKSLAGGAVDIRASYLRIEMAGMNKDVQIAPEGPQPGRVNYFLGNDPHKWRTNIPTFKAVLYKNAWPGIDIKFYGDNRRLEYDIIAKPGADPSVVRFRYSGAKDVRVTKSGDLAVELATGRIVQQKPVVYQLLGGRRVIRRGVFIVSTKPGRAPAGLKTFTCSFDLGAYDRSAPLVVDPTIVYSTYVGGSVLNNFGDTANSIAIDTSGNAYITGSTYSVSFPVTNGAFQTKLYSTAGNAFVTEVAAGGASLVYSTYLGGNGIDGDRGIGIAVDASGNAYVTGETASTDFPVTTGAFQTKLKSTNGNGFVTELAPGGTSLVYSTFLGGSTFDSANGIALDASGNAYVTGLTGSADFPVTGGAFQTTFKSSGTNAFVTEVAAGGASLVYSTYLGGSDQSFGGAAYCIAVDASGNAYVAGQTDATDFPVTGGAFQTTFTRTSKSGNGTGFVTEVAAGGASLVYSSYLGGSGSSTYWGGDKANGIAVDASGDAYVTGFTDSPDFPVTSGAFQTSLKSTIDNAFVTEVAPGGGALVYSTYLGGSGNSANYAGDGANGIAIDASGDAYVAGFTSSTDFPVTGGAFQSSPKSTNGDAFVTEVAAGGASLVYSSYLGGSGSANWGGDGVNGIAVDASKDAYVAGFTASTDFPVTSGAFQTTLKATSGNGFVAEISAAGGLWQNAVATGNGWYYLDWFGAFDTNSTAWIYHQTMGWLYPVGTSTESIWFYDPQWDATGGWWWTSNSLFPWLYSVDQGEWLYFDAKDSTPAARWFFTAGGQASTH